MDTSSTSVNPSDDFMHTILGGTGLRVFRLGLSGSYWPGSDALRAGIDGGMNYLFWYYWDRHMTRVLREVLPGRREQVVVATGAGNLGRWALRWALERCLKRLHTDYIDIFHCFWVGHGNFDARTRDLLLSFKEEGKIRHIAISSHARTYAGELVRQGQLDVLMMRYNAAHRGAEQDIFPHLANSNPGVVSYTATRWGKLLTRPPGWPKDSRVPTAGDCYRFVLTNPHVHVCLCAPRNRAQIEENLTAVRQGPLSGEDMAFMRDFGDAVHDAYGTWFR